MVTYSVEYEFAFRDGTTSKWTVSNVDSTFLSSVKLNVITLNDEIKDNNPEWFDYIVNKDGSFGEQNQFIATATIVTQEITDIPLT